MEFQIDTSSRLPIYRQLRSQLREAVARGKLLPEHRLPSVRELSRTLVVNPNTVARVYTELEREGLLNTRPGLGVFVATPKTELTKKVRKERLVELLDHFLTKRSIWASQLPKCFHSSTKGRAISPGNRKRNSGLRNENEEPQMDTDEHR